MNKKLKQNYEELARNLGLRMDEEGGALYGRRGAYDMIVYAENSNYPNMLTVMVSAQRQTGPLMKDVCKQFKRENKPVSSLTQNGSIIAMKLKNYSNINTLKENLDHAMNALVNLLHAEGFKNCCQICGKENPSTCYVSGSYMHLCSDCFSKVQHGTSMDYSQKQSKSENVIGGIVGALLGSLLGVLSIIVFSQMGYVAVLSGVILAICTLKGYELMGGKLSKKGIVISIILMIVMTYVGDRIDWAIVIARELEVDSLTAFQVFPELLAYGGIDMGGYISNLVMQYLFVLLGAIPTVINTMKNEKLQGRTYRLDGATQNIEYEM